VTRTPKSGRPAPSAADDIVRASSLHGLPIITNGKLFKKVLVEDEWSTGKARYYRRSLTDMIDALAETGCMVERIRETRPAPASQQADPEGHDKLSKTPRFIIIRAVRK
jgi:hypothetical protein